MKVFKSIVLVAAMISIAYLNKAQSEEEGFDIDFDILKASYSTNKGILNFETKEQVGSIVAKKFIFDSDMFSFYIQDQNGVEVVLSADAKKFYFEKSDVGYAHNVKKLGFLEKVSFFDAKNFVVRYNAEEFLVNQEYLVFRSNGNNLYEFSNFNFYCPFGNTLKFGTSYEKLLYYCMNNGSLEKANLSLPSPMVKMETEKFKFKTLIDHFSTTADQLKGAGSSLILQVKSEKSDSDVAINDFSLDCNKEEFTGINLTTPIMRGCYNKMKYVNNNLSLLSKERESGKTSQVSLKTAMIEALPNHLTVSGDHFQFKSATPKESKSAHSLIKKFNAKCKKKAFNRDNLNQSLIDGCYESLSLSSEELTFGAENQKEKTKNKTTVLKSTLTTNEALVSLNASNLDVVNKGSAVSVKDLVATCAKNSNEKSLATRMMKNCLSQSKLVATSLKYGSLEDKSSSVIHQMDFSFLKDMFKLSASKIVYNSAEDSKISINNAGLSCQRASITKEKIDAQELIKGCFNSSQINLTSIEYLDPSNSAKLNISSIALDKSRIDVTIPTATYNMNKGQYNIDDMSIHCSLSANFDLVKAQNWKKIVSNCLRDLTIGLGKVRNENASGIFKINKYDDVKVVVKNNQVILTVVAKNTLKVSAKATVTGKVFFKDDDTKMVFEIDKTKIKLFSLLPIPSESIFDGILRSLVKDKRITSNDNVITVDLSGSKK